MGNARSAETVANGRRVRAERDAAHAKAAFKAAEWAAAVPADLQIRILDATVTQLLAMLESRVVTSVQLVSVFAARSYSIGFSLRAVTEECYDQAFAAAAESDARRSRGEPARLLEGIPVSIKEHIAMAGYYATCGMAAFCARPASQDALVVTLLKDAGAIPLVRSNVPQLLMLPESDNAVWGNAVNPFHAGRTPGGSSGGEGALIAARCTPLGVGTDIGGSIRIPAHFCGVYGFKPTAGRLSNRGVAEPKENGVDGQNTVPCTAGPMGRCTDDLVLAMRAWSVPKLYTEDVWAASRPFDAAVYYAAPGSRRLRIGVLTDDRFFTPAAACLRAVREAEAALRAAGHEVVAFTPSDHGLDTYKHALNYYAVMAADGGMRSYVDALRGEPLIPLYSKLHSIARLPNWLRPAVAGVLRASGKPRMADLCLYATGKSAYELWLQNAEALVYREAYVAAMRAAGIDIILCPGYGLPATPHGASGDLSVAASWTFQFNYLNFPAGTVPVTHVRPDEASYAPPRSELDDFGKVAVAAMREAAGLPVGVQLVGLPNADELVLHAMKQLELALAAVGSSSTPAAAGPAGTVAVAGAAAGGAVVAAAEAASSVVGAGAGAGAHPAGVLVSVPGAGAASVQLGFAPEHVVQATVAALAQGAAPDAGGSAGAKDGPAPAPHAAST